MCNHLYVLSIGGHPHSFSRFNLLFNSLSHALFKKCKHLGKKLLFLSTIWNAHNVTHQGETVITFMLHTCDISTFVTEIHYQYTLCSSLCLFMIINNLIKRKFKPLVDFYWIKQLSKLQLSKFLRCLCNFCKPRRQLILWGIYWFQQLLNNYEVVNEFD